MRFMRFLPLFLFFIASVSAFAQSPDWQKRVITLELEWLGDSDSQTLVVPPPDQAIIEKLRFEKLTSDLGRPDKREFRNQVGHNGYSAGEYLDQLLRAVGEFDNGRFVFTVPLGTAISQMYELAKEWVEQPQVLLSDLYPKIMINRCVDFFQLMLPVSGENTEEVQRIYANFWSKCYVNGIAYANNNLLLTQNVQMQKRWPKIDDEYQRYLMAYANLHPKVVYRSMAMFAYEQAQFFYKNTATEISSEAQAVGLIRLLGYLGSDLHNDQRNRHPAIGKTLTTIGQIRKAPYYISVLQALKKMQVFGPEQKKDVRLLRLNTSRLLSDMPGRLKELE